MLERGERLRLQLRAQRRIGVRQLGQAAAERPQIQAVAAADDGHLSATADVRDAAQSLGPVAGDIGGFRERDSPHAMMPHPRAQPGGGLRSEHLQPRIHLEGIGPHDLAAAALRDFHGDLRFPDRGGAGEHEEIRGVIGSHRAVRPATILVLLPS